jgi:hypothetical protein
MHIAGETCGTSQKKKCARLCPGFENVFQGATITENKSSIHAAIPRCHPMAIETQLAPTDRRSNAICVLTGIEERPFILGN